MNTNDTRRQALGPAAAFAALVVLVSAAVAEPAKTDGKPKVETDAFPSGGECIAVEYCAPTKPGKHPALVLLHAVDGLDDTWGPLYRDLAVEYAGRGYVVVRVHYFDRTDLTRRTAPATATCSSTTSQGRRSPRRTRSA
jgi:dienelactone hydrolase